MDVQTKNHPPAATFPVQSITKVNLCDQIMITTTDVEMTFKKKCHNGVGKVMPNEPPTCKGQLGSPNLDKRTVKQEIELSPHSILAGCENAKKGSMLDISHWNPPPIISK